MTNIKQINHVQVDLTKTLADVWLVIRALVADHLYNEALAVSFDSMSRDYIATHRMNRLLTLDLEEEPACPQNHHAIPEHDHNSPCIYLSAWGIYNHGSHRGGWIQASTDPDEMWADYFALWGCGPHSEQLTDLIEEPMILDSENFHADENDNFSDIAEYMEQREKYEDVDPDLLEVARTLANGEKDQVDTWLENYVGTYESAVDYVREQDEDEIEHLLGERAGYYDWESQARDDEINCRFTSIEVSYQRVFIFVG